MSKEGSSDLFQEPHCLPTMWAFWEALCNRTFPSSRNSPMGHTHPTVHIHTELSYIAGGSGKWYSHSGRELAISYKHRLTTWPSNPTPRHLPKRNKNICPKTCSWMFIAASFIIPKAGNYPYVFQSVSSLKNNNKTVVHLYRRILLGNKKQESEGLIRATIWINLKWTMLHKKANFKRVHTACFRLYNVHELM